VGRFYFYSSKSGGKKIEERTGIERTGNEKAEL
jgi:hypothetical protein